MAAPPSALLQQQLTDALRGGAGGAALTKGLGNLVGILSSQGQVDPRARNRALVQSGRSTEAQQLGFRQRQAQGNLQGSRALDAIHEAIGLAGADRAAAIESDFTQQAEERKRKDLLLLLQLIIGPSLQQQGITNQALLGSAQIGQQRQGAGIGGLATLGSAIFGIPGLFGGNTSSDGGG